MTERMNIIVPRSYVTSSGEAKTSFTRIGVAFQTKNGWSLIFEALPVPSLNDKGQLETKALLMPPLEPDGARQAKSNAPPANFEDLGIDQSIPF